jgi:esterase/lipase
VLEGWIGVLAFGLLLLVAANTAIFLYACYEYATSSRKEPWQRSTQILQAKSGNAGAIPSAILLHGFGGTPRDLRSLAERLAERGLRVVVPEIPEQTSTSFAYSRGRWSPADFDDWLGGLIRDETAISGQPPVLVGTSMGGTLAAIGAAHHRVSRLVLIAPYFSLAVDSEGHFEAGAKVLQWVLPVIPKYKKAQMFDPAGYKDYETGSYLISLRAFLQLAELARIARGTAPDLAVPTLVLASEKDTVAAFPVTERFCQACQPANLVLCNQGNHILTYDFGREDVLRDVVAFLTAPLREPRP